MSQERLPSGFESDHSSQDLFLMSLSFRTSSSESYVEDPSSSQPLSSVSPASSASSSHVSYVILKVYSLVSPSTSRRNSSSSSPQYSANVWGAPLYHCTGNCTMSVLKPPSPSSTPVP